MTALTEAHYNIHTHTHPFNGPLSGTTRRAGTRKVKPIWILLKQETVSGSGNRWAICKSAPRSRQITTPVPHHSDFYRPDSLPATQPTASKHWRDNKTLKHTNTIITMNTSSLTHPKNKSRIKSDQTKHEIHTMARPWASIKYLVVSIEARDS